MNKLLPLLALALAPALSFAADTPPAGHDHATAGMAHDAPTTLAGQPGRADQVSRTIAITLDDAVHFTPGRITVKAGETVRFFVRNAGRQPHEMVLGTAAELQAHAEMMRTMPDMHHAGPNMIRLAPGQRGGIVWQFGPAGEVDLACLLPGHQAAGMAGKVTVE